MPRRKVVAIFGGSEADLEDGTGVAKELDPQLVILLTGGRGKLLNGIAQVAQKRGVATIGVHPDAHAKDTDLAYDLFLATGLGDGRNYVNAMACDVAIALAGGSGTLSEIALALKTNPKRHVVLLNSWERLRELLPDAQDRCHYRTSPRDAVEAALARAELIAEYPKIVGQDERRRRFEDFIRQHADRKRP